MPLERQRNLLLVPASITGHPLTLLVDTGAERTVLSETAATGLGLRRDPRHPTRHLGIGGISTNFDVEIPGLVLGNVRFPLDRVAVVSFGSENPGPIQVDGLLGADVLLAFDLDLDPATSRLTLYRVRQCADVTLPWNQTAVEITGADVRRDRMVVPIELDGVSGTALLDTGAQSTVVSANFARRAGVADAALADDRTIIAHGASPQAIPVHVHRFHELRVGPAEIVHPALAVVPSESGVGDGLVGGDFLGGRRVWLSFATKRLFVSETVAH